MKVRLTTMWDDMFSIGIPLGERILRGALLYLFVLVAMRVAGKREIGQFTAFDLVVVLLLSETVSTGLLGEDHSVTGALVGAGTILGLNRLVTWLTYHVPPLGAMLEGRPTPLIEHGARIQKNLDHELISDDELMLAAHKDKIFDEQQIEKALLELDGTITIVSTKPEPEELHAETVQLLDELKSAVARVEESLRERGAAPART
jgi:uncharacterized membrane protein YcaP (DUF421 family)